MRKIIYKYRIPLLFIFGTLLYCSANIQRVAIPGAVFDQLQMQWNLSASQVTSFGAFFMYVYAVSQLAAGLFCDRYGGARTITGGGILFAAGIFAFALSDNYYLLCLARILTGIGASAFYLGMIMETIRYFKKNYSIFISFIIMTGYAGGIIANAPFSFAAEIFGLKTILLAAAVISLVLYIIYLFAFREVRKPPVKPVKFSFKPFIEVAGIRHNWYVFAFSCFNWGLYYSLQTVIGKKFLEDFCSISTGNAAITLSITGLLSALAGFVYAVCSKKIGNRRKPLFMLTACTTFSVFLLLTVMTAFNFRTVIPAVLLCALASTASLSSTLIPVIKETNRDDLVSSAISLNNAFSYILVAFFGNMIGTVLSFFEPEKIAGKMVYSGGAYFVLFLIMLIFASAELFCAFKIRETFGRKTQVR